jgi:hypothetical protein
MRDSTRRGFLKIAGAGVPVGAAVAATAVVRSDRAEPAAAEGSTAALPKTGSGPLVAYVRDVRSAEVSVLVGETEVVLHDRDLVAELAGVEVEARPVRGAAAGAPAARRGAAAPAAGRRAPALG